MAPNIEKIKASKVIFVTHEGHKALVAKKTELTAELRRIMAERAGAFEDGGGTWHDNPAFEEVERRERMTSSQIQEIEQTLLKVQIVPERPVSLETVAVGTVITLENEDGTQKFRYVIGGYQESDLTLSPQRIAYNAPIVSQFFGQTIDHEAEVVLSGKTQLLVLISIE